MYLNSKLKLKYNQLLQWLQGKQQQHKTRQIVKRPIENIKMTFCERVFNIRDGQT